jgi:hypothetical protein
VDWEKLTRPAARQNNNHAGEYLHKQKIAGSIVQPVHWIWVLDNPLRIRPFEQKRFSATIQNNAITVMS